MDPLLPPPPVPPPPQPTATTTTVPIPSAAATPTATVSIEVASPHNHVAHAANATPSVPQSFNHPPYAEMIYAAIAALKERDGSSKRAIAKYIERVYSGLPPTHSALLTHHLKRLKNSGHLVMVKKSYKLPRSDLPIENNNVASAATTGAATAAPTATPAPTAPAAVQPGGAKRGRGRPPKPKIGENGQQYVAQTVIGAQPITTFHSITQQLAAMHPIAAQPSQPMQQFPPQQIPMEGIGQMDATQPVFVALGLAEDPKNMMKKRPGRPKKVVGQGGQVMVGKKGRGRPPKKGVVGRPRKPKTVTGVMGANAAKRGPGRPPKIQQPQPLSTVVPVTYPPGTTVVGAVPKPRGRPKKAPGGLPAGNVMLGPKRAGRPPKAGVAGVVAKPRKSTGRPVGRPKKGNASWPVQPQAGAYGDLKQKLDFFQAKVKQAVGFLRPLISPETEPNIAGAILELEGLASMEINTPLREEPQPQLPLS